MRPRDSTDRQTSYGLRLWSYAPGPMREFHLHADIELNHVTSGGLDYLIGGRPWRITAGQTVLFWGGLPHRLVGVDSGTAGMWGTVPAGWFLVEEAQEAARALLAGQPLVQAGADDAQRLSAWELAFARGGLDAAEARCLLQARCLAFARDATPKRMGAAPTVRKGAKGNALAQAMRLAEYLSGNAEDADLSIDQAAARCGLTPRHAATIFQAAVGMGPHQYLTSVRVATVQRHLLTDPDARILDVALTAGFASSSRFYASFRDVTGMSPTEWIERLRASAGSGTVRHLRKER